MDRVELNGRPATAEDLGGLAFAGYGHFTSMQMRAHLVRGLDLHLERLARDSLELFGREVDRDWRRARKDGFDDVLFVGRDGYVSEGSIWNIGFFDGDGIVWPAAPALRGITMQLVQAGLRHEGVPSTTRSVHLDDLPGFRSAVLMNSIVPGRPVVGIDGVLLEHDPSLLAMLLRCYQSNQGQPVAAPASGGPST